MKIRIGYGSCGIAAGAKKVKDRFNQLISEKSLDAGVSITGCIGMCFYEPIVDVIDDNGVFTYANVTPSLVDEIIESHVVNGKPILEHIVSTDKEPYPQLKNQVRIVLRNCGIINPEEIDEYVARDGYKALKKVVTEMTQDEVIEEVKVSGLRGRGGAGFPTWFKWDAAKKSKGTDKYVVCNADEGDPGAFMDRGVLEGDPHSVLEGMAIAGYAMGANNGFIYCRAEYPLAIERLKIAIKQAREKNYLGKNILGSGFDFDIDIKIKT